MTTSDPASSQQAISRPLGSATGRGCLGLFFAVFLVMGTMFFYWFTVEPIGKSLTASGWQAIPCTITASHVESHRGDDSTTYSVEIEFDYKVAGVQYHGDRYSFANFSSSGRKGKQRIVAAHPVGAVRTCYVDTHNPTEAVINPKITGTMFIGSFTLIFVIVGAVGLAYTFGLLRWKPSRSKSVAWQPTTKHATDADPHGAFGSGTGSVTLRPQSTRWGRVVGLLLVALFWNGIVSVFLWQVVEGFQRGRPSWFLVLFLVPFVLVGLGLVAFWVHSLLGLLNPRAEVTLSQATFELGEPIDLSWRMIGNANAIRQLTITIEGQEWAEYRRGTSTYTDRETFTKLVVVDTDCFMDVGTGNAQFTVPREQMHSFEADHNKVVWMLKLKGEIGWWPDISEEYKLGVMPHPVAKSEPTHWEMPVS